MLYIFGDSFSVSKEYFVTTPIYKNNQSLIEQQGLVSWIDVVSNNLNTEVENYSTIGAGNEWIMNLVLNKFGTSISDNDYVIVQLSASNRRWFFNDRPHLGNFHNTVFGDAVSKSEQKAVDYYGKYLWNETADAVNLNLTLLALKHIALNTKAKVLVIAAFNEILGVKGCLNKACFEEFNDQDLISAYYREHGGDLRLNHLSKDNHIILADQVINFFTQGTMVDFDNKFIKNIYK